MATPEYYLPFCPTRNIKRRPAPFHKTVHRLRHCIDFAMPIGTPILAARNGKVIACESRYNKNYTEPVRGHYNFIKILHPDGSTSEYVHLAWRSLRVRKGQEVRRGQIIALSGDVGYATYPHLHFGVYDVDGKNIKISFKC